MIAALLFGAGAVFALIYQIQGAGDDAPSRGASTAKTTATGCLTLAALTCGAPGLIILGLALGMAGDYVLTRPAPSAFLAGMAAFAAGHLAYAAWMFTPEHADRLIWALPLIALALSAEWWLLPRTGSLHGPVRAYIWVISLMGAAALSLPQAAWPAQIGAALFILSDLLLALRLFVVAAPQVRQLLARLLWPAYWIGQALILAGTVRAA
ncbi:MAG: lysoplasmalogenase family protein [Paracoccus sp. (in: a-proteobacteria)]